MICPYQTRARDKGRFACALGMHGGSPWPKACLDCLAAGQNTPEYAAELAARRARSHPEDVPPVQGCCDRADLA